MRLMNRYRKIGTYFKSDNDILTGLSSDNPMGTTTAVDEDHDDYNQEDYDNNNYGNEYEGG